MSGEGCWLGVGAGLSMVAAVDQARRVPGARP